MSMSLHNAEGYPYPTPCAAKRKTPKKKCYPTESEEQIRIFEWAALHMKKYPELCLMYHVPNGGLRNKAIANRLKLEGVKSGVSDIHLPVSKGKYIGLWIELKVGKNKPTQNQLWWIEQMNNYGHYACVAYGFDEAKSFIEWYLNVEKG